MPAGGLPELREEVAKHVAVVLHFDPKESTPMKYFHFMRTLAAHFYVDNVQGRAGGFSTMTLQQGVDLLRTSELLLERSKTAAKYGYQPIAISETSRDLLGCYLYRVRVTATNDNDDDAPLWVNGNGTRFSPDRFGRLVTSFFKAHKQL
jgi:hypothetical protein